MDKKDFIMEMFLDCESVLTVNRTALCLANIIQENSENLNNINETVKEKWDDIHTMSYYSGICVPPRRMKDYYEEAVMNFNDDEYFSIFKVKRSTVETLINFFKSYISPGTIPLDKKVHVFLMYMMSDLSFSDIGRLYGLHKSSTSYIFQELGTVLKENYFNFINWPSAQEQHVTRLKVNNRFKFPNCVGFIDTCRFRVRTKSVPKPSKYDTILLQAVCDESLMFIDIHIGEIGQVKKAKVFKESSLVNELQNYVDCENHILGDSEYKLSLNLITPFNSEELLTSEEMKFNEVHWNARSYISRAFEMLKEKFRKLNHIDTFNVSVNTLIYSACVLHNFILMREGCPDIKEETISSNVTLNSDITMNAVEKRQFLCNYINYMNTSEESVVHS